MSKKGKIRILLVLSALLGSAIYINSNHDYTNSNYVIYEIENEFTPFGAYRKGNIYIGKQEYIEKIKEVAKEDDVLIEQGYKVTPSGYDANYKIHSSYVITDKDDRNDILNVLNIYNALTDTDFEFDRTIESMRVEWSVHNILYRIGIEQYRTKDVDINNSDEKIYSNKLLRKLIK